MTGAPTFLPLSSIRRPSKVFRLTLLKSTRTTASGFFAFTNSTASAASQISAGAGDVTTMAISGAQMHWDDRRADILAAFFDQAPEESVPPHLIKEHPDDRIGVL